MWFSLLVASFRFISFHSKLSNKYTHSKPKKDASQILLWPVGCRCVCKLFQKGISFHHLFDRKYVFDMRCDPPIPYQMSFFTHRIASHFNSNFLLLLLLSSSLFLLLWLAYATLRKLMCMCVRWALTHAHTFKYRIE